MRYRHHTFVPNHRGVVAEVALVGFLRPLEREASLYPLLLAEPVYQLRDTRHFAVRANRVATRNAVTYRAYESLDDLALERRTDMMRLPAVHLTRWFPNVVLLINTTHAGRSWIASRPSGPYADEHVTVLQRTLKEDALDGAWLFKLHSLRGDKHEFFASVASPSEAQQVVTLLADGCAAMQQLPTRTREPFLDDIEDAVRAVASARAYLAGTQDPRWILTDREGGAQSEALRSF
jgi:hypothetical protein